jgi:hypothetical protein
MMMRADVMKNLRKELEAVRKRITRTGPRVGSIIAAHVRALAPKDTGEYAKNIIPVDFGVIFAKGRHSDSTLTYEELGLILEYGTMTIPPMPHLRQGLLVASEDIVNVLREAVKVERRP